MLEVTFHRFSLQPALVFSQKGERFDATTSISGFAGVSGTVISTVNRYNWLELPVNVVYALHGFQVSRDPMWRWAWAADSTAPSRTFRPIIPDLCLNMLMRR